MAPHAGVIRILTGGAVGERIVLESKADNGLPLRWSFNDIRVDSFVWRGEKSADNGATWRLAAEYHLQRRKPFCLAEESSCRRSQPALPVLGSGAAELPC